MIWILFYYNSLPDMPEGCLLFSNDMMHRDFFKCNPTNTDHYQYPKFETLSYDEGCHCREVNRFLERHDPDKYVVFYTRHTSRQEEKKNKIVGYFKVGKQFENPRGFSASESVLLPKNKCIGIPYSGRGVPVSWGNSSIKNYVAEKLKTLITNPPANIEKGYKEETKRIMDILNTKSGKKKIIEICETCEVKSQCYWGRKTRQHKEYQLKELYGENRSCYESC